MFALAVVPAAAFGIGLDFHSQQSALAGWIVGKSTHLPVLK